VLRQASAAGLCGVLVCVCVCLCVCVCEGEREMFPDAVGLWREYAGLGGE